MRLFRSLLFQAALWAILPLLAITAVSVGSIYGHQRAERELVADRIARLAHVTAGALTYQLEEKTRLLQSLAETERVRPGAVRTLEDSATKAWEDAFDRGILLLFADGSVVAELGDARDWYASAAAQELRTRAQAEPAAPRYSIALDGNRSVALVAVAAPDGETLLGGLSPASLGIGHLFDDLLLGARGAGYVVDLTGSVIYQQPEVSLNVAQPLPGFAEARTGRSGALFYDEGGESWAVGYAPVVLPGWVVIVRESWADAIGPMAKFAVVSPVLVIIAAFVSLIAVYLILNYVVRPLQRLRQMADRVAWGDFTAVEQPLAGVQESRELHSTLRHMVNEIQRYQAGMQSYVTAVTQGQEEERKRLARELHDDTAQSLVGLVQRIKLARRDLKRDPVRVAERLAELEQLATAAWEDVRRFSEDLRPAYLEQFGLEPALATLGEQVAAMPGAPGVSFVVEGAVERLRPEVEFALFRIVQEALNNVRQHAGATQSDVTLRYKGDEVTVIVSDDGRGFSAPESPAALARSGHFGLAGAHERALLIGARLIIDSAPGRGTRIEVSVPLDGLHRTVP